MLTSFPSPPQAVWHLGPFPLRAYALCILTGIFIAIWVGSRRVVRRGGPADAISEIAMWAVPFGIVGGRLYHVIFTDPDTYFPPKGDLVLILKVWEGGLGIMGAVAMGVLGTWIACRRMNIKLPLVLDSLAPGVAIAQGIGRLGNYFNQELYGKPTDVAWAVEIDEKHRPSTMLTQETYHPTFLYEMMWNFLVAAFLIIVGNKLKWRGGQVFFAYLAAYAVGRIGMETLRIDPAQTYFGFRPHFFTAGAVLLIGLVGFWIASMRLRRVDRVSQPTSSKDSAATTSSSAGVGGSSSDAADSPSGSSTVKKSSSDDGGSSWSDFGSSDGGGGGGE